MSWQWLRSPVGPVRPFGDSVSGCEAGDWSDGGDGDWSDGGEINCSLQLITTQTDDPWCSCNKPDQSAQRLSASPTSWVFPWWRAESREDAAVCRVPCIFIMNHKTAHRLWSRRTLRLMQRSLVKGDVCQCFPSPWSCYPLFGTSRLLYCTVWYFSQFVDIFKLNHEETWRAISNYIRSQVKVISKVFHVNKTIKKSQNSCCLHVWSLMSRMS